MADLHLPNLAEPVATLVEPPAFDTLVGRARDRRRRQLLTGAAVAVVVVLAVIASTALATRSSTAPPVHPPPTPTPTPTKSAKGVDADTIIRDGDFNSYVPGADGRTLTTWRMCDKDATVCKTAWRLEAAGATRTGLLTGEDPGEDPFVMRAGSDFVFVTEKSVTVLHGGGRMDPVHRVGHLEPRAGDALQNFFVPAALMVIDPSTAEEAKLPPVPGAVDVGAATVSPDGTVFAVASLPPRGHPAGTETAVLRGDHWRTAPLSRSSADGTLPGYVVVSGSHVAAISTYDGATIAPLGTLGVSEDTGRTWTLLHKSDVPFEAVDTIAATSTGTLFVATPDGRVYRSAGGDWTRFVRVALPEDDVTYLQPAGSEVRGLSGGYKALRVLAIDDHGDVRDLGPVR